MVVGGTPTEWRSLGAPQWAALAERLGLVAAEAGARWLTLRPYGPDDTGTETGTTESTSRWIQLAAGERCTVIVDPTADGRVEFARAAAAIPADVDIDEAVIDAAFYAPADAEPDLILILGPLNRLPPSLVWELAYAELVYSPARFSGLGEADVTSAIDEFNGRNRRFGGLDTS